jgi:EmrB/QacA subfamily drug resistance transporter
MLTKKEASTLVGISLITFIEFLDVTIVSTALPAIQHEFVANLSELQWILNSLFLTLSALMATTGRIGDLLGRRRVLYIGAFIFLIASIGAAFSPTIGWLIFFRFLQGVAAAIIPVAAALLANHFPVNRQAHILALFVTINGIGLALGPLIGGVLVQTLGWRWIFLINIPIILISLALCAYSVQEQKTNDPDEKIDVPAALAMVIGISAFMVALTEGPNWGWDNKWIVLLFALAIITLSIFYQINRKSIHPVIDFELFRNRYVISAGICCFTIGGIISVLLFLNPIYLQSMRGQSAEYSGVVLLAISGTFMVVSLFSGKIVHQFGVKASIYTMLLLCVATSLLHMQFSLSTPLWFIILAFIMFGIPWSLGNVAPTLAAVSSVDNKHAAVTLGSIWTLWNLGSCITLAISGSLLRHGGESVLAKDLPAQNIFITDSQLKAVGHLISDPEHANQLLSGFTGHAKETIAPILKDAFMHGFDITLNFLVIFCIALGSAVYLILRNAKDVQITEERSVEY